MGPGRRRDGMKAFANDQAILKPPNGETDARLVFLGDGLPPGLGGGAEARLAAGRAAQPELRSADRPPPVEPLSRRVRPVRRGRARHHGQRAPQHLDLPDRVGADGVGDHRPRDQARAPPVARHADREPARPGARRRGDGVARRVVGRPAGDGPRQGRTL